MKSRLADLRLAGMCMEALFGLIRPLSVQCLKRTLSGLAPESPPRFTAYKFRYYELDFYCLKYMGLYDGNGEIRTHVPTVSTCGFTAGLTYSFPREYGCVLS